MVSFIFKELHTDEIFDPTSLSPDCPFTQAKFYGDWQKNLNRTIRRFTVLYENEVVAYFQIVKYPLAFGKHYLYIPYGPITNNTTVEFFSKLKEELLRVCESENAVFVRLDFSSKIPNTILSASFTKSPSYTYHSSYFQPRSEWFLELTPAEGDLLAQMHEKTRYSIRVAEKKEITTEVITKDFKNYFDVFHTSMRETALRNHFSLHSKEYYQGVFDSLEKIKNAYLVIAKFNGQVIAINLIIPFGNTANYVFGASSNTERNRMPTYLALWQAIVHAKSLGLSNFNFGAITGVKDSHKGWEGISSFKKRFGGFEVKHGDFFDVVASPFWYHLYNLRKRLKNS